MLKNKTYSNLEEKLIELDKKLSELDLVLADLGIAIDDAKEIAERNRRNRDTGIGRVSQFSKEVEAWSQRQSILENEFKKHLEKYRKLLKKYNEINFKMLKEDIKNGEQLGE